MANEKKKAPVKKLDKKAMKSVKGGGGLIIDLQSPTPTTDLTCRKQGGDGNPY
jgi:hypothetical protein